MFDAIMEQVSGPVFLLTRATLLLSVAFCAALFLVRATRCRSWRIHRLTWLAVLAIGVLALLPVARPVELALLEPGGQDRRIDPLSTLVEIPREEPAGADFTAFGCADVEDVATPDSIPEAVPALLPERTSDPIVSKAAIPVPVPAIQEEEPRIDEARWEYSTVPTGRKIVFALIFVWLAGMILLPLRWLYRTIRFHRFLKEDIVTSEPESDWTEVWQRLQTERGIRRPIPLLVAEHFGPALTWRFEGTALIVPLEGWDRLSEPERESVMRHEREHYLRSDIVKSLLVRLLALPHWFNPLAWLAVGRFEEAAEWACDEAALVLPNEENGETVSTFARALVSLHETSMQRPRISCPEATLQHNIFGRDISRRVARLLSFNPLNNKDSIMKKVFLLGACAMLVSTAFVQVRLVAKNVEAQADPVAESSGDIDSEADIPSEPNPKDRLVRLDRIIKYLDTLSPDNLPEGWHPSESLEETRKTMARIKKSAQKAESGKTLSAVDKQLLLIFDKRIANVDWPAEPKSAIGRLILATKSTDETTEIAQEKPDADEKETPLDPMVKDSLFKRGREHFQADRFTEAKPLLEKFVEKYPSKYPSDTKLEQVLYYLGKIAQEMGNPNEAAHYYGQSIRLYPGGEWAKESTAGLAWAEAERNAQQITETPVPSDPFAALEHDHRSAGLETSRDEIEAVEKRWKEGRTSLDHVIDVQIRCIVAEYRLRAIDPGATIKPIDPLPVAEILERYEKQRKELADPAYRNLIVRWMNAAEECYRRQLRETIKKNPEANESEFRKDSYEYLNRVFELGEILGDRSVTTGILRRQIDQLNDLRKESIPIESQYFSGLIETKNRIWSTLVDNRRRMTSAVPEGTVQVPERSDRSLDFWHQRMIAKHKDYLETEIKYLDGAAGGRILDRERARLDWLEARIEYDFYNADLTDLRIAGLFREESAKLYQQAAEASFDAGVVGADLVQKAKMEALIAPFGPTNTRIEMIAALEKYAPGPNGEAAVLCLKTIETRRRSGPPSSMSPGLPEPIAAPDKPGPTLDVTKPARTKEEVEARLELRIDLELDENHTFEDLFQIIEEKINVQMFLDTKFVGMLGITKASSVVREPNKFRSMSIRQIIQIILRGNDLTYEIDGGVLTVTTPEVVAQRREKEAASAQMSSGPTPAFAMPMDPDYVKLLEKRVETAREIAGQIEEMYKIGAPGGRAQRLHETKMNLAAAEAELYRIRGDGKNYREALKRKLDHARQRYQATKAGFDTASGGITRDRLLEAELAVAEVEYELKQAEKTPAASMSVPSAPSIPPRIPGEAKKEPTFQGKTFGDWVEELKTELDPNLRAEAFRALTVFGANGKGKEAAEAIVGELRNYDYNIYDDSPAGKMKEAAIAAFVSQPPFDPCIPPEDSIPVLVRCFREGTPSQQSLACMVFVRFRSEHVKNIDPGIFYELLWNLKDNVSETVVHRLRSLLQTLGAIDPSGEYILRFLDESLKANDADRFSSVFAFYFVIEKSKSENPSPWFAASPGIYPSVFSNENNGGMSGGMGGAFGGGGMSGNSQSEKKLTPFGEKLLRFLREKGMTSENETIRETSEKVADGLLRDLRDDVSPIPSGPGIP